MNAFFSIIPVIPEMHCSYADPAQLTLSVHTDELNNHSVLYLRAPSLKIIHKLSRIFTMHLHLSILVMAEIVAAHTELRPANIWLASLVPEPLLVHI